MYIVEDNTLGRQRRSGIEGFLKHWSTQTVSSVISDDFEKGIHRSSSPGEETGGSGKGVG